ncbi:MAG: hypothetical protein R3212_05375, partial [Xanthomonadales bacterium]|nr:hypothetical protein [Xanthomonadales bacterium]
RESLRRFDELVALDSENLRWTRDRLETLSSLLQAAEVADLGPLPEDRRLADMIGQLDSGAVSGELDSPQRAITLAAARALAAHRSHEAEPDWRSGQMQQALDQSGAIHLAHPDDAGILEHRAEILLMAADHGLVDPTGLEQMAEILAARASASTDALLLAIASRYALRLWPAERAEPLIERLIRTGYQTARFERACRAADLCR